MASSLLDHDHDLPLDVTWMDVERNENISIFDQEDEDDDKFEPANGASFFFAQEELGSTVSDMDDNFLQNLFSEDPPLTTTPTIGSFNDENDLVTALENSLHLESIANILDNNFDRCFVLVDDGITNFTNLIESSEIDDKDSKEVQIDKVEKVNNQENEENEELKNLCQLHNIKECQVKIQKLFSCECCLPSLLFQRNIDVVVERLPENLNSFMDTYRLESNFDSGIRSKSTDDENSPLITLVTKIKRGNSPWKTQRLFKLNCDVQKINKQYGTTFTDYRSQFGLVSNHDGKKFGNSFIPVSPNHPSSSSSSFNKEIVKQSSTSSDVVSSSIDNNSSNDQKIDDSNKMIKNIKQTSIEHHVCHMCGVVDPNDVYSPVALSTLKLCQRCYEPYQLWVHEPWKWLNYHCTCCEALYDVTAKNDKSSFDPECDTGRFWRAVNFVRNHFCVSSYFNIESEYQLDDESCSKSDNQLPAVDANSINNANNINDNNRQEINLSRPKFKGVRYVSRCTKPKRRPGFIRLSAMPLKKVKVEGNEENVYKSRSSVSTPRLISRLRSKRCGSCSGCLAQKCGTCNYCRDNPEFGGQGTLKQVCINRRCQIIMSMKKSREKQSLKRLTF